MEGFGTYPPAVSFTCCDSISQLSKGVSRWSVSNHPRKNVGVSCKVINLVSWISIVLGMRCVCHFGGAGNVFLTDL